MAGRGARLVLAGALILSACSSGESPVSPDAAVTSTSTSTMPAPPFVGPLRLGVIGSAPLDPALAVPTLHGDVILADLLYDGLTELSSDGEVVASLASSWESNESGDRFEFELEAAAAFHDGSRVTAGDVKMSLERLASGGDASLAGARLEILEGYDEFVSGDEDGIVGIEVVDDQTVSFATTDPYFILPHLLAGPSYGIVPEAAAEDGFFDDPVGSGPLRFVSRVDAVTRLEPVAGRALGLAAVELVSHEDAAESFEAFDRDQVDWSLVPEGRFEEARVAYGDDAVGPFHATFFLGFNTGLETYADHRFRQAITAAIDRETIVEEVFPSGMLRNELVPQGLPAFREGACGEQCDHDPDRARALIVEVWGDDGPPPVALDYRLGTRDEQLMEMVSEDLESVGLEVELRGLSPEDYREFVVSSEQEIFVYGWVGVIPSADVYLSPLYLTGSADNVMAFSHDIIDAGLAAGRAFADPLDRIEAFQGVEALILIAQPTVPLVQTQTVAVLDDEAVEGWDVRIDGTFDVETVRVAAAESDPEAVDRTGVDGQPPETVPGGGDGE